MKKHILRVALAAGVMAMSSVAALAADLPASVGRPPASQPDVASAAMAARPMATGAIVALYENRSWIWEAGAGFFDTRKRRFIAWTAEGGQPGTGEGIWFVQPEGQLCFDAVWTGGTGSAPAVTCFEHRTDGTRIYQRRLPSGPWYVFGHEPARRGDALLKVRMHDYVSAAFERNRTRLATVNAR